MTRLSDPRNPVVKRQSDKAVQKQIHTTSMKKGGRRQGQILRGKSHSPEDRAENHGGLFPGF